MVLKFAYYNDTDLYCCAWLRNLIKAKLLPDGAVDQRPIQSVTHEDIKVYNQCHFFAGIGGWPYALRLAGWPDDKPVWTGSCPCQPFSVAGKRKGTADPRHLWPDLFRLIRLSHPSIIFGEQVGGTAGRSWLSRVGSDLARETYQWEAVDIPSCSVGAPHIRQRLFWVADSFGAGLEKRQIKSPREECSTIKRSSDVGGVGHTQSNEERQPWERKKVYRQKRETRGPSSRRDFCGLGQSDRTGPLQGEQTSTPTRYRNPTDSTGFWGDFDVVSCLDKKSRRVEPGTFPLAYGIPARVGKLRAYGNAINPILAAEFIKAYLECRP